ncbi:MAG: hypothetical protein MPW14_05900 [Candidatus Manganitrophus sp.]|nr:MAG: hypothetical protein MPW14_05900 [Candidatus Manganitrophus sp.]
MIVLDDRTCPVGMLWNLEQFFARESCGWCTPCRERPPLGGADPGGDGAGEGEQGDLEILREQTKFMAPGNTFCALAPGAMEPLASALNYFQRRFRAAPPGEALPVEKLR